jgi:hypothetical protein
MYIEFVPNRNSRPTVLLREAWREGGKVRKRTIANLTGWPDDRITAFRLMLKGEPLIHPAEAFVIEQSLSCGHVHALLKLIEKIRLREVLGLVSKLKKNIIVTMVVHALFSQNAPHLADYLWQGTTILDDMGLRNVRSEDVIDTLENLAEKRGHIESQIKPEIAPVAAVAYDNGIRNSARVLIHLMADHVNMNLHRALSPLLSHDAFHKEACTHPIRNICSLSLYSHENTHESVIPMEQSHALSLLDIVDHLTAQCHIRLRITSIPGGLTVNLRTPASPLQTRVLGLIESYDGNGQAIKPVSWRQQQTVKRVSALDRWGNASDPKSLPTGDMDRSHFEIEK